MEKFNVLVQAYQHLKHTQRNVASTRLHLVCQNVNTQTSRDPSRAAPLRPEFELGIYEFT